MASLRPIVTLLSDFGAHDWYVAAMKLAVRRACAEAELIDVTHLIAPGDVQAGSIALSAILAQGLAGAVHLGVVDPGVGGTRKPIIVRILDQFFVGPDNGLITWAWRRLGPGKAFEIAWKPSKLSDTFHGRDLFAPVAGMLAAGTAVEQLATPLPTPVLLDLAPAEGPIGKVIHIDQFGNAMTNILGAAVPAGSEVSVGGQLLRLVRTYASTSPGEPLALVGSSDMLEIAVRDGSAAERLGLRVGMPVRVVARE